MTFSAKKIFLASLRIVTVSTFVESLKQTSETNLTTHQLDCKKLD